MKGLYTQVPWGYLYTSICPLPISPLHWATIKVVLDTSLFHCVWLGQCYVHRWIGICPATRWQVWNGLERTRCTQSALEHHVFCGGSICCGLGFLLGYCGNLDIFREGSITTVWYQDEILDRPVRLYAAAVGPAFILMMIMCNPVKLSSMTTQKEGELHIWSGQQTLPNRNSIAKFWDVHVCAECKHFPPPPNFLELQNALQEEWQFLDSAVGDYLMERIVTCSKLCIQMKDAYIPY